MQLGMVGAGRMGANMARRLAAAGIDVRLHDVDPDVLGRVEAAGVTTAATLSQLVASTGPPRVIWLMIPSIHVGATLEALTPLLAEGDVVVDGGNSFYRDAVDRAASLARHGVHFVDCGTSGGVHGATRGYCLMLGGSTDAIGQLEPVLDALAPGVDAAPRTPGRSGPPATEETGWLHCGPPGSGHFAKMVHNGIEYGMMAAYAEGLALLRRVGEPAGGLGGAQLDVAAIVELWRRGSVVGSWLLDLAATELHADPELAAFDGRVGDSGEGRWTVQTAVDLAVPVPVLSSALWSRFASRGHADDAGRVLSALRHAFGGHTEPPIAADGADLVEPGP